MATQFFSSGLVSIPTGSFPIPQITVPQGTTKATISIARNTTVNPTFWPNVSTTIEISIEVSYDNGATFLPGGGGTSSGGLAAKNGVERPATIFIFGYSAQPTNIRGQVIVTNGPLVTTITGTVE